MQIFDLTITCLFLQSAIETSSFTPFLKRRTSFKNTLVHNNVKEQILHNTQTSSISSSTTVLFGGTGTTANYTWKEDQFDIEIKIPVPAETRAKHVSYKAKSKSMELSIEIEPNERRVLLHGGRQFRGMIDLDGTFWSLHDVEKDDKDNEKGVSGREIVVSIEKLIIPPNDPFAVVEYDWGSVYMNDEDEITAKNYAEPEELDIREYASSLGVDIDNINMTMVDKSMFSSGLNLTRSTLDELTNSGYVKEVTRQSDGMEFVEEGIGSDKRAVPFKSLGDKIGDDELEHAGMSNEDILQKPQIPFIDTDSPWRKSMPVEEARGVEPIDGEPMQNNNNDNESIDNEKSKGDDEETVPAKSQDPIDRLTVSKLKDILRKEGLKVSGNKKELQSRLKDHVSSILQKKKLERQNFDENV